MNISSPFFLHRLLSTASLRLENGVCLKYCYVVACLLSGVQNVFDNNAGI